jgi:hypothetical protein
MVRRFKARSVKILKQTLSRSFHALDSLGHIYAWGETFWYVVKEQSVDGVQTGQLDNGFPLQNEGFEARDMRANEPVKLQFPDDTQIVKLR